MKKILGNEKGAVAIIIAVGLVALMLAVAMTIDVGSLFEERRLLQTVADSAALAGAQELPEDPDEAIQKAIDYANNNYGENVDSIDVEISSTLATDDTITVTVLNPDAPLYFARVTGKDSTLVGAQSRAIVAKPRGVGNVVPWGLDKEYYDTWVPGGDYPLKYHTPQEPGNFMAVDLDGLPGGGSNDYVDRIKYGYDDLLYVGDTIYTETGNMAGPTVSATNDRVGVPIGDGWEDFFSLTDPCEGGYKLTGVDTQFIIIPIISLEDVEGGKPVIIEGFVTLIVTSIEGVNPGESEIIATFVNRALIKTEGAAIDPVGPEGLRVIRLIK